MPDPNVECVRCGHRWYAREYARAETLPEECPTCYQESVREIPPPPSRVDLLRERVRDERRAFTTFVAEKHHDLVLWKENNHALLQLIGFLLVMGLVSGGLALLVFSL